MQVTEPLLQTHHGLAAGGETKVPGFDDAGVNRADGDLMQALALGRQERIGLGFAFGRSALRLPEGVEDGPPVMVQPGPRIRQTLGIQARQVVQRPLQADRRRMQAPYRRKTFAFALVAEDCRLAALGVDEREVHEFVLAPQSEQRALLLLQQRGRLLPAFVADKGARPGTMLHHGLAVVEDVAQCLHVAVA